MPTIKEQNAAFDAINAKLHSLSDSSAIPSIPFIDVRAKIKTFLDSKEGRKKILEMVKAGLFAAEKAREDGNGK